MKNATPLSVLDAFAIDTETTGLDPRKARIVEIAAVRISAGALVPDGTIRRLVNPGERIPISAVRIHGIDDSAVSSAQGFATVWPELSDHLRSSPLIGHSLGFDLAVISRECATAKLPPPSVPALDIALLARAVAPSLPGYSLEQLATWLDVAIEARHSALGDATTAARIFCAMIPHLRKAGVRTLAEAQRACRDAGSGPAAPYFAGWSEPASPMEERLVSGLDSVPYRHRVGEAMSTPARFLPRTTSLRDALAVMVRERISSILVGDLDTPLADVGIVTERDAMRAVEKSGPPALDISVAALMSHPLAVIGERDFIYKAAARMNRLAVRHLAVTDEAGNVVGMVSARDLLRSGPGEAISLGDEIDHCEDVPALAAAWARLPGLVKSLRLSGMSGRLVAAVISEELGRATMSATRIAERRMAEAGLGEPPCPYAMTVLGSAGRGESLLAFDQDNALVFAAGEPGGAEDHWFAELGTRVSDILHEIGVPYCKGGVMARNPGWRGSLSTWRHRIADWTRRPAPEDLLSVDIFFDLKPVSGEADLANTVRREAIDAAAGDAGILKLLAEPVGQVESGLTLFGRFRTQGGRLDLKRAGLFGIVAAVRALAVRYRILARSTSERIEEIMARSRAGETDLQNLAEAQGVFLDLVLDQQIADIERGIPPSNSVGVKSLSRPERDRLRRALEAVRNLDVLTRDILFSG